MAQLIDQVAFFEKYNIKEEDFSNTKLTWEELSNIYNDYLKKTPHRRGGVFLRYRSVNQDGIFIEKSKGYELVTEVLHSVAPLYNKSKNSRQR